MGNSRGEGRGESGPTREEGKRGKERERSRRKGRGGGVEEAMEMYTWKGIQQTYVSEYENIHHSIRHSLYMCKCLSHATRSPTNIVNFDPQLGFRVLGCSLGKKRATVANDLILPVVCESI
jgi:hypothetical protein